MTFAMECSVKLIGRKEMELLSTKKTCERLGIHPNTSRKWADEGIEQTLQNRRRTAAIRSTRCSAIKYPSNKERLCPCLQPKPKRRTRKPSPRTADTRQRPRTPPMAVSRFLSPRTLRRGGPLQAQSTAPPTGLQTVWSSLRSCCHSPPRRTRAVI